MDRVIIPVRRSRSPIIDSAHPSIRDISTDRQAHRMTAKICDYYVAPDLPGACNRSKTPESKTTQESKQKIAQINQQKRVDIYVRRDIIRLEL